MKRRAPPLRFLLLVLGGWLCLRAPFLVGDPRAARDDPPRAPVRMARPAPDRLIVQPAPQAMPEPPPQGSASAPAAPHLAFGFASPRPGRIARALRSPPQAERAMIAPPSAAAPRPPPVPPSLLLPSPVTVAAATQRRAAGRWSGSAWLHLRRGRSDSLAPGGTLGGSQAGFRINYRLNGDGSRRWS